MRHCADALYVREPRFDEFISKRGESKWDVVEGQRIALIAEKEVCNPRSKTIFLVNLDGSGEIGDSDDEFSAFL